MLAFFYGVLHDLHSTSTFCKTILSLPGTLPVSELNFYQVPMHNMHHAHPLHPTHQTPMLLPHLNPSALTLCLS